MTNLNSNRFSLFLYRFVYVNKKSIKSSKDGNTIYLSSRELCLISKSYIEWFSVFPDVSLHVDYLQKVSGLRRVVVSDNSFSEKNINTTHAHWLFPCHNLTTKGSKFDEWKSGVPLEPLPIDRVKVGSVFQREALVRKQFPKGIVPRVFVSVSLTKHTLNAND